MTTRRVEPGAPRSVVNQWRRPAQVPAPPGPEVQEFHERLVGYRPTRLHSLADVAAALGVGSVRMKDESDRLGLPAFKILGVSWAVERVVRAAPGTRTLVAATAGNHGRAVARSAAERSLACRIYLPAVASETRAELIAAEGAEVVRVDGTYDDAVALAARAAVAPDTSLLADTSMTVTDGPPAWVIDGYSTLFRETAAQAPVPFDVVLVPAGAGAFTAAAVRWAVHEHSTAAVVAVEPDAAACVTTSLVRGAIASVATPGTAMAGMDCATPSAVAWPTLRDGLAGAITVTDGEASDAMRELADLGLTVGDCGAATLAALRALVTEEACESLRIAVGITATSNVLCVATEGASDPVAYERTLSGRATR